jgi:hypothetical protein
MRKIAGVSSVRVSLNEGLTVLELAPENTVTLAQLRQVIRNNGFVTKEAQVVAAGTVSRSGGLVVFEVSGSRERYTLQAGFSGSGPLTVTGVADITDPKAIKMTVH